MKKMYKIMLTVLVALTLCLTMTAFAAEGEMALTLEPAATTVSNGQTFEVTFSVAENPGFRQAEFSLHYDAAALQVQSVNTDFCAFAADTLSVNTETAGVITVNVAAMSETEGEHTATGQVFTVCFQVAEEFAGEVTLSTATTLVVAEGEAVVQEATCVVTVEAPAAHVHTEETIPASPATCTEPGWTEGVKCAECGEILTAPQYIAPNGHTPDEAVQENVIPATCQADGSYESVVYCSVCNEEMNRETVAIPTTGEHNYAAEQERVEPTCTEDGYVIRSCECGETQTETLPATGHMEVMDAAVEPTCTESGLTEGCHCEVCGEVIVAQETVEALGHTAGEEVKENEVPVSCQTDGSYDRVVYCTVCEGEVSRKTIYIPTTGEHNYATEQDRVEPTCTVDGYVVMACGCGETQNVTLPAVGHTEVVDAAVEATCTEPGLTEGSHCEVCGETVVAQEESPAKGHAEMKLAGYAATCTEPGLTDGTVCSECGIILVAQEQTPLADHSEEFLPGYAPTCKETGMTDGSACAICGEVFVEQVEIPMIDHTPVEVAAKAATCSETGHTAGTKCEVCGDILSGCTKLQKLAHTEVVLEAREPTCNMEGWTEGRYCSVCGEITLKQLVVAKVDHTPETIPAVEPTCSEVGWTEGSRCAVCSEVLEDPQQIPTVAHEAVAIDGQPATCTATGLTQGQQCGRCGTILEPQQEIPVLDHQYAYSCDPDCEYCGAARASLQHEYGNWIVVREATEESTGEHARTCKNCGHKETRIISPLVAEETNRGLLLGIAYAVMAASAAGIIFVLRKRRKA